MKQRSTHRPQLPQLQKPAFLRRQLDAPSLMPRCRRDQSPLTFAGVLFDGNFAYRCLASFARTEKDEAGVTTNVMVSCTPDNVRGAYVRSDGTPIPDPVPWAVRNGKTGEVMLGVLRSESGKPARRARGEKKRSLVTPWGVAREFALKTLALTTLIKNAERRAGKVAAA